MGIHPLIALSGTSMDNAGAVQGLTNNVIAKKQLDRQATQDAQNKEAHDIQIEEYRMRETARAGLRLKSFLDRGDAQGAEQFLLDRNTELGERIQAGENIDNTDTVAALESLQSGDFEGLRERVGSFVNDSTRLGYLPPDLVQKTEFKSTVGKIISDRNQLASQFGEGSEILSEFDRLVQEEGDDAMSDAAFNQKLQLEREKGKIAAEERRNDPSAQLNRTLISERIQTEQDKRQQSNNKAEQDQVKFEQQQAKAIDAKKQTFTELDEAIALAQEISKSDLASISGPIDALTSQISGTEGATIRAKLDRLFAISAFGTLQTMRNNSPTGGALGQVSERELALLGNAQATLDPKQKPSELKKSLEGFISKLQNSKSSIESAFARDFPEQEQSSVVDFNDL